MSAASTSHDSIGYNVPEAKTQQKPRPDREPGAWRDDIVIHEDFDELPEEMLAAFNGDGPLFHGASA